jgi:ParB family chromosome partitioning protein
MPFKIDDFFTTQEERDDMKKEKVEEIDISLLDQFPNHPFKVLENEDLKKLTESVKDNGILEPIIVRKKDNDRYEIISGHRRKRACELNNLKKMPCIIRNMTDDEATIYMVDSNMHREIIMPSEKAFAYKMRLDAMRRRQGERTDLTSAPVGQKFSRESLAELTGDSHSQIQRYIRLTELIPTLLDIVDEGRIGMRPAVELSYLTKEEQSTLADAMSYMDATPSHDQAIRMRKMSGEGKLTPEAIEAIMGEEKPNQREKISFRADRLRQYIPKNFSPSQTEDYVMKALEHYSRYLDQVKRRNEAR